MTQKESQKQADERIERRMAELDAKRKRYRSLSESEKKDFDRKQQEEISASLRRINIKSKAFVCQNLMKDFDPYLLKAYIKIFKATAKVINYQLCSLLLTLQQAKPIEWATKAEKILEETKCLDSLNLSYLDQVMRNLDYEADAMSGPFEIGAINSVSDAADMLTFSIVLNVIPSIAVDFGYDKDSWEKFNILKDDYIKDEAK